VSDGHDRLRQYLEQRRELGESEFVLDGLSVEDALKMMTGRTPAAGQPGAQTRGAAPSGSAGGFASPSPSRDAGPPPARPDSAMRRTAEEAAAGGDWREALRAVGSTGDSGSAAERPTFAANSASKSGSDTRSPSASGEPLIVGANSAPSGLDHLKTLDDVASAIGACQLCTLHSTKTKDVPGEGNPLARFVVVGEAPGQTEDELGKPFVGKSGELLTKILEAIGFKRDDVFICNVLKHRPPGNRNPASDEIVACRPFLLRQLELLQPKVILAVGTFAAQTLLETDSPIGKLRGLEHRYHGIPLVATYHPAALLRNPNWKRPAWEDVQLARRIFDRP
jgi:uracil-DNA glycosylase family 4